MNDLKDKIEQWAVDRNLHTADPMKQLVKLGEEYGELCSAMVRNDIPLVIDSAGDMFVVMTILCLQLGLDIGACVEIAYEDIKHRKGRMINGVFVKEADLPAIEGQGGQ